MVLTGKNPPANTEDVRDAGLIPRLGRAPAGKHSNSFQYSCLENSMDRGAWWAIAHGVTKSQTENVLVHIKYTKIFMGIGASG